MRCIYYKGNAGVVVREQGDRLILIVEDSELLRYLLAFHLARLGYFDVHTARDGRAAVEKASTGVYEMVLMDLSMPEMDGFEATRLIRQSEADSYSHVPIIAVTGDYDRQKCLAAGMDDYIAKPVTSEKLRQVTDRWLVRV